MKRFMMELYFGGRNLAVESDVEEESLWRSIEKGVGACAITWLLGIFFIVVPFVNWTLPAVFLVFGPVIGIATYFADRRMVNQLDADAACPQGRSHEDSRKTDSGADRMDEASCSDA